MGSSHHLIKVMFENLPSDMDRHELKDLAQGYASAQISAHNVEVWKESRVQCGCVALREPRDAERLVESLNGRRMKDISGRLRVWEEWGCSGRENSFDDRRGRAASGGA